MAITKVTDLEREYGVPIDNTIELLASAISVLPFKDEEDVVEKSKDDGTNNVVDVGDPLMQERKFRLIEECCKLHLQGIADDRPLKSLESTKFFLGRTTVEYIEMKKEIGIRPDIWIGILNDERECFNIFCGKLRECLNKTSCQTQNTMKLLENVKKTLLSCVHQKAEFDAVHATQAALDSVNELGSHPILPHLIPVDTLSNKVSQVASKLTGLPPSWLSSSLMPPSPRQFLLKKFFGQEHAVAAVENVLASTKVRNGRPLGTFLFHDPSALYWEDFAKDISYWLYATTELSLQLDLSADVDTLLISENGKGKLCEVFEDLKKKPFAVVVLEKVDQAHDSVIEAVCRCLTDGCNLEGDRVDFSKTIFIMVSGNCFGSMYTDRCPDLSPLFNHSSRRLMDLASDDSSTNGLCVCRLVMRQLKDHMSPKIWDLVDDVVMFSTMALCCAMAYARIILRDIASKFCGGRLIIYPSEEALVVAFYQSDRVKIGKAVKRWLEVNIVPTLQEMVDRNDINENSIVFIDACVGTNDLSYRVEKLSGYLGDDDISKNFTEIADCWRAMYVKGKVVEDNITSLRKRLVELCTAIKANVETISITDAMQECIEIVDNANRAAGDISSSKEVYGCSVEKANAEPSVSKKAKSGVESLRSTVTSNSARPEIIEVVKGALLRTTDASVGSKRSPSSYLLLGLENYGKRELLVELESNLKDAGIQLLKVNLLDHSSEDSHTRLLACSPRSLSDGHGWLDLVETVREHPYCVLYFDQIERASMPFFSLLMSLLVHGIAIDSEGNVVDFGQTVILISSDIGNKHLMAEVVRHCQKKVDIVGEGGGGQEDLISSCSAQEGCRFRSELVHKVDEVLVFDPFACEQLKSLARIPITTKYPKEEHINSLRGELELLFNADVDLRDKRKVWSSRFSRLLNRVNRQGTANGL